MAKPGRKPKPTELKRLQGNPGKRPLNEAEPQPEGVAKMPHGLKTHYPQLAKRWEELAAVLEPLGLLTEADGLAFRLLLQHYQFALEAAVELREAGSLTRMDENGVERKHPLLQIFRDNSNMYRMWAAEFGLTPSSRARLKVDGGEGAKSLADELFEIINQTEGD